MERRHLACGAERRIGAQADCGLKDWLDVPIVLFGSACEGRRTAAQSAGYFESRLHRPFPLEN